MGHVPDMRPRAEDRSESDRIESLSEFAEACGQSVLVREPNLLTNESEEGHYIFDVDRVLQGRSFWLPRRRHHALDIEDRVDRSEFAVTSQDNLVRPERKKCRGAVRSKRNQNRPGLRRLAQCRCDPPRHLEKDLDARTAGLANNPPSYVVGLLGPRPDRAANAQLWDVAAARIDQHREAFDISDEREILGSPCRSWDDSAFATSQRAAFTACDALDRTLGRGLAIEPPGLELGL